MASGPLKISPHIRDFLQLIFSTIFFYLRAALHDLAAPLNVNQHKMILIIIIVLCYNYAILYYAIIY